MLLTKDNLLRFVREKKFTIPADVASHFETSTMIASAALSELAKEASVKITDLKLSSSPYYYDPRQKEALEELGEKHFKGNDLVIFKRLRESQLINDNSLTIPEQLAMSKISDFAVPLELEKEGLKFWVWYLRDLKETKTQILDYLGSSSKKDTPKKEAPKKEKPKKLEMDSVMEKSNSSPFQETVSQNQSTTFQETSALNEPPVVPDFVSEAPDMSMQKDKVQDFIENYLRSNYLVIEEKDKLENGYFYSAKLKINKITVQFDCRYFSKKVQETDIIKFYTSSMNPKIVFIENAPKKLFKLSESIENLELVNI